VALQHPKENFTLVGRSEGGVVEATDRIHVPISANQEDYNE